MRIGRRFIVFAAAASAVLIGGAVQSKDLVVDLSAPVVQITTGFSGTDLLLFGAKSGEGDIVVVVRGPAEDPVVRRKERVLGVWVNNDQLAFEKVPSFYWYASNRAVEDILPAELRSINQIGIDDVDITPVDESANSAKKLAYQDALVRRKIAMGLYAGEPGKLVFVSDVLFRTNVKFPANVSVGEFAIETYLVRDQKIVATDTTLLNVRKFGLGAAIYNFAHRQALLHGIVAVVIACFAGWLANAVFRRR